MRGKVKRKNRSFEAANKQQQQQQQSFYDAHISFLWENPPPLHHLHHKIKSFGRLVYHTLSLWMNERIMIIFNALFSMYLCVAVANVVVVGIFSCFQSSILSGIYYLDFPDTDD